MKRYVAACVAIACGSTPPAQQSSKPVAPVQQRDPEEDVRAERLRRQQLAAAHHKLEAEQQDALAATCKDAGETAQNERCLPSCYQTEPADPRSGKKIAGAVEIAHLVCDRGDGAYAVVDELANPKQVVARAVRRVPAMHKPASWEGTLERALAEQWRPKLARGDTLVVTGAWRDVEHPLTKTKLRCVTVSHHVRGLRKALDDCGGDGSITCEARGNPTARAINVVHYRLAEAKRLQAAGQSAQCQQAALEAIAVARGLPRWRQYVQLNVGKWVAHAAYRTRFDGLLDEESLFTVTAALGAEAERVHAACGGPARAQTTAAQEQSFHTCW